MGLDAEEIEKLAKWTALILAGITEIQNIVNNKRSQAGKTDAEVLQHAEEAQARAKELVNNL